MLDQIYHKVNKHCRLSSLRVLTEFSTIRMCNTAGIYSLAKRPLAKESFPLTFLCEERPITATDRAHLARAINLAREAERAGNLPIGCVICLDDRIVAQGQNAIWSPKHAPHRHAELEALRALPASLAPEVDHMTLYTTLEPCMMCAGAILLHRIGRVVFGAADPYGGIGVSVGRLPPYFAEQYALATWIGPACSQECGLLYQRVTALEADRGP